MNVHRALAPAKINLGLCLGPTRAGDGRHELVSVMQSISLADELTLEAAPEGSAGDEILCPGVTDAPEENLAAAALRAFRESTGWDAPPLRLAIVKRIPVAAGLGGGSADAAATLRLARHASGLGGEALLLELATALGADVPAQVSPGRWLATGAGEQLHALPPPRSPFGVLVLPLALALSTGAVYAEADRLGLARSRHALAERGAELAAAFEHGASVPAATELLHNDLQRAAVSLCPEIAGALAQARAAGADLTLVSGSGPTVLGLFPRSGPSLGDGVALAESAAVALGAREPAALAAVPVQAAFARPHTLGPSGEPGQGPPGAGR
jgi:4-diphosphocytidyl-2-C-methyl-D-erythritol kinase